MLRWSMIFKGTNGRPKAAHGSSSSQRNLRFRFRRLGPLAKVSITAAADSWCCCSLHIWLFLRILYRCIYIYIHLRYFWILLKLMHDFGWLILIGRRFMGSVKRPTALIHMGTLQEVAQEKEWVAVDGGTGRACRGKSAGDNLASYFTVNSVGRGGVQNTMALLMITETLYNINVHKTVLIPYLIGRMVLLIVFVVASWMVVPFVEALCCWSAFAKVPAVFACCLSIWNDFTWSIPEPWGPGQSQCLPILMRKYDWLQGCGIPHFWKMWDLDSSRWHWSEH